MPSRADQSIEKLLPEGHLRLVSKIVAQSHLKIAGIADRARYHAKGERRPVDIGRGEVRVIKEDCRRPARKETACRLVILNLFTSDGPTLEYRGPRNGLRPPVPISPAAGTVNRSFSSSVSQYTPLSVRITWLIL